MNNTGSFKKSWLPVFSISLAIVLFQGCGLTSKAPERVIPKIAKSGGSSDSDSQAGNEDKDPSKEGSGSKDGTDQGNTPTDSDKETKPIPETPIPETPKPKPDCFKVMTFNLRYDSGSDSASRDANGWNNKQNPRFARVKAVLDRLSPDIIGTQEGLNNQIEDLKAAYPTYDFWGVGREDGKKSGEYAGIFYKKDTFKFISGSHFWLSQTPETPGTTFPGEGNTRMASLARLQSLQNKKNYLVVNSHWGLTASSRKSAAKLIISRMGSELKNDETLIILGDLNAEEGTSEVSSLRSELNLTDLYRSFHPMKKADEASFHDFTGETNGERIDHILMPSTFEATAAEIAHDNIGGLYPSDHFPLQVNVCEKQNP